MFFFRKIIYAWPMQILYFSSPNNAGQSDANFCNTYFFLQTKVDFLLLNFTGVAFLNLKW